MALKLLKIGSADKVGAAKEVREYFENLGFKIVEQDLDRPWGFYYYFDPRQTKKFISVFFGDVELSGIDTYLPLQPKVLVFESGKMNSWQYHHRRAEIWRVITNSMQAVLSKTDDETPAKTLEFGDVISFERGIRHRGGATPSEWCAVAEIWQHTDPNNLSNEEDIIRLQDNYGRAN